MSILSITQLNNYIQFKFKSDVKLKGVMVQGEISNFNCHFKSGHFYFTLKDDESSVKCVMFSSSANRVKFVPENGLKVIVSGNIEVYTRDGVYQIYVNDMQPFGIGAHHLACEQLKIKLEKEGLFDENHKKPLPLYPTKIGIITSSDGAGLKDLITILERRYPVANIHLFPAIVQGENSSKSLCKALLNADNKNLDLIIIGRGGGSYEDLYSFNNEDLARKIYNCKTPIISAVGHETDTTIADYVADLRASTPSAAAELATPNVQSLIQECENYITILENKINNIINNKHNENELIYNSINKHSPQKIVDNSLNEIEIINKRLYNSYVNIIELNNIKYNEKINLLNSLNPLNILSRGYSLVYKDDDLINNGKSLKKGDEIKIKFKDSEISAIIK